MAQPMNDEEFDEDKNTIASQRVLFQYFSN